MRHQRPPGKGNPRTPAEFKETEEIRRFLGGESAGRATKKDHQD